LLFALCGAGSSRLLDSRNGSSSDTLLVSVGIAFALLALFFFWRSLRGILTVPIVVVTWIVAYNMAAVLAGMDMSISAHYLPMCVGGLIGGLGLYLCDFIVHREFQPRYFLGICVTGAISALPFGSWLSRSDAIRPGVDPLLPFYLAVAFAIWQAAVGTHLYILSRRYIPDSQARPAIV
jgi:hypothetical protein